MMVLRASLRLVVVLGLVFTLATSVVLAQPYGCSSYGAGEYGEGDCEPANPGTPGGGQPSGGSGGSGTDAGAGGGGAAPTSPDDSVSSDDPDADDADDADDEPIDWPDGSEPGSDQAAELDADDGDGWGVWLERAFYLFLLLAGIGLFWFLLAKRRKKDEDEQLPPTPPTYTPTI